MSQSEGRSRDYDDLVDCEYDARLIDVEEKKKKKSAIEH